MSTYALARFMDWLADEEEQGKRLSDRTIANAVIPLRAALATAKREGLIRRRKRIVPGPRQHEPNALLLATPTASTLAPTSWHL